jgi:undecaprenyl-diphosphatase
MTVLQSILLGIIQGLTEFLPISSSAHLVLAPAILGWHIPKEPAFAYNVLVQLCSLVGVFAFFWKDISGIVHEGIKGILAGKPIEAPQARLGWLIILGTVPAGLAGLLLKGLVKDAFNSPVAVALFLLVTAFLLILAERQGKKDRSLDQIGIKDTLWIGVFQAIAIFPGISRSGATITGGLIRNLERATAARFSFLLSIPIMLAAGALEGWELIQMNSLNQYLPIFIPGFIASAITSYLAIRWLIGFLAKHSLKVFAIYCICASLITLAIFLFII